MIKPTVGRVVIVWARPDQEQPHPATITFVHSDDNINVVSFDRDANLIPLIGLFLWNGGGEKPPVPYAEWMPYQKGQAAKVDELERALKDGYTRP